MGVTSYRGQTGQTCPPKRFGTGSKRDTGLMYLLFLNIYASFMVLILYDLPVLESLNVTTPLMSHLDVLWLYTLTLAPQGNGGRSLAVLS